MIQESNKDIKLKKKHAYTTLLPVVYCRYTLMLAVINPFKITTYFNNNLHASLSFELNKR